MMIQVAAYAVFAGLGAISVDCTEAKMGQHLGMGILVLLGSFLFGFLLSPLQYLEGFMGEVISMTCAGLFLGGIAFFASFFIYSVNARQAMIIGIWMGSGHILMMLFLRWAFSTG